MTRLAATAATALLSLFAAQAAVMPPETTATGAVRGTVVDGSDGKPVQAADVMVTDLQDKILVYGSTDTDGHFGIGGIPAQEVLVLVRMMGYDTFISDKVLIEDGKTNDLGTIRLARSTEGLDEATVTADKSRVVYKLDRQVISGSSSITSAGGTAADVLAGIPSFLIDVEGNVSFRGSDRFLVYVNGKPSPLEGAAALRQIPAASIENIEILTTPSARYRTDGDAGIINITTKRNMSDQWSGIFTATGSSLGTWSLDGNVDFRKGKSNWYAGGTFQQIKSRSDFNQRKTTSVMGIETTSVSDGERWRNNGTYVGRAGWQYSDGKKHNLSVDLQAGKTDFWRGGDMAYDEIRKDLETGATVSSNYDSHDRYNLGKDLFQASVDYVWHLGEKSELDATSRLRYDSYSIEYTESNMFDRSGNRYEGTRGYEEEHHWDCDGSLSFKHDYRKGGQFETGYQYTTYSEHGGYRIKYWNRDTQSFDWQDDLATPFYYRRQVHSVYAMVREHFGNLSLDAGLRGDRVLDLMEIEIVDASRDIKRFDLFPSAHLQYDARKAGILSFGYSYRTNRPGIWNLEPYITYEDYYTKKIGNPDILPEYVHSSEALWRKSYGNGNSLTFGAYYRYRRDISDWIRTAYEPGVTLDVIVNAGNQTERGVEIGSTFKPAEWWNSTASGSLFDYRFVSRNVACTDAQGNYFQVGWMNTFQISRGFKVQFDANAVGPKILTQGREKAYYHFNLGARKQLLGDKLTLSAVVQDVFHTAKYFNTRSAPGLVSQTAIRPRYPNAIMSLTWNFNSSSRKDASQQNVNLFEGKDF